MWSNVCIRHFWLNVPEPHFKIKEAQRELMKTSTCKCLLHVLENLCRKEMAVHLVLLHLGAFGPCSVHTINEPSMFEVAWGRPPQGLHHYSHGKFLTYTNESRNQFNRFNQTKPKTFEHTLNHLQITPTDNYSELLHVYLIFLYIWKNVKVHAIFKGSQLKLHPFLTLWVVVQLQRLSVKWGIDLVNSLVFAMC